MCPLAAVRLASLLRLAVLAGPAFTVALAGAPAEALAQAKKPKDPKTAEAKRLFDEGSDAYADGRYEDAVKAWEKSYELSGKPLIFESIGNAYERLGDKKKAREYLARWRAAAPPAEHEQLDARIKNLDARIAAAEAVPCTAENQYTVPIANSPASAAFSNVVRRLRLLADSFSSARKRNAGPIPASHRNTCPSFSLSAPPASFTNGTRITAGNGGKLTKCSPS